MDGIVLFLDVGLVDLGILGVLLAAEVHLHALVSIVISILVILDHLGWDDVVMLVKIATSTVQYY